MSVNFQTGYITLIAFLFSLGNDAFEVSKLFFYPILSVTYIVLKFLYYRPQLNGLTLKHHLLLQSGSPLVEVFVNFISGLRDRREVSRGTRLER